MRNLCKVRARDRLVGDTCWASQTQARGLPFRRALGYFLGLAGVRGRLGVAAPHLVWLRISRSSLNHIPLGCCWFCFVYCWGFFCSKCTNAWEWRCPCSGDRDLDTPAPRVASRPGLPRQSQGRRPCLLPLPALDLQRKLSPVLLSSAGKGRGSCSSDRSALGALGTNAMGSKIYMIDAIHFNIDCIYS